MRTLAVVAVALALAVPALPSADEAALRKATRAALTRYGPALVTVHLTVKARMIYQGREESGPESTMEVQGTTLTPDGLTAVSDASSNPMAMAMAMADREGGPQIESDTSDVKMILPDGRELPARFVLRDADLDVAFLAPLAPVSGLPCVKLEKRAVPEVLDDLILLSQLGRSLDREVSVTPGRVRAVVRRPRTFVVPDPMDGYLGLGGPALDGKGRPVGLVVLRRAPRGQADTQGIRELVGGASPVVLSAADVLDLAAQAEAARARTAAQEPEPEKATTAP